MIQKLNLLYLTNNQRILTYNFIITYLHKWNHSKQTNIVPRINIHVLLSVKREIHENKCLPFLGIELKTTSLFVFTMFSCFYLFSFDSHSLHEHQKHLWILSDNSECTRIGDSIRKHHQWKERALSLNESIWLNHEMFSQGKWIQ